MAHDKKYGKDAVESTVEFKTKIFLTLYACKKQKLSFTILKICK